MDEEDEDSEDDDPETFDSDRQRYTPTRTGGSGAESEEEDWRDSQGPAQRGTTSPPEKPPRKFEEHTEGINYVYMIVCINKKLVKRSWKKKITTLFCALVNMNR